MKNFPENQFIDERVFLANGSTDFPIIVPENTLSILAPPIRVSPPSTQIVYPNNLCFCQIRFNLHYTHSGVTLTRVNRTRVLLRFQTLVPHFSHLLARSRSIGRRFESFNFEYSASIFIISWIIYISLPRIEANSKSIESYRICANRWSRIDRDPRSSSRILNWTIRSMKIMRLRSIDACTCYNA